jgi:hypothetical protein
MRRALSEPRTFLALGVGLGLLIACLAWFVPYLTREREAVSGVPVPPPFFVQEQVNLKPRSEACLSEVAVDTDADFAEFTVLTGKRPGARLAVAFEGQGYRETATVPAGYTPPTVVRAPLDPPDRSVIGTLCIRNTGERRVALLGTSDARTVVARPTTQVDGEEVVPDVSVRFLSAESGSVLERLGEMMTRLASFNPGLLGAPALLWLLLVLVVVGIPTAAIYAVLSSFRDSDCRDSD